MHDLSKINQVKIRKRYGCCNGSKTCALNRIERAVDKVLNIKDQKKRRDVLMDWILNLEEEIDILQFQKSKAAK